MPLFSVLLNFCSTFTKVSAPLKGVTYVPSLNFKTYPFVLLLRRKPWRCQCFTTVFAFFCHFCCPMSLFQGHVACMNIKLANRHTAYNPPFLPVYVHFPIIFSIFSVQFTFLNLHTFGFHCK